MYLTAIATAPRLASPLLSHVAGSEKAIAHPISQIGSTWQALLSTLRVSMHILNVALGKLDVGSDCGSRMYSNNHHPGGGRPTLETRKIGNNVSPFLLPHNAYIHQCPGLCKHAT